MAFVLAAVLWMPGLRAAAAVPPPAPRFSVNDLTRLVPGQTLEAGQSLVSANGQFQLSMQPDGNLVEHFGPRPLWASQTNGHPGAHAVLQSDGNLMVRSADGSAVWGLGTGAGAISSGYLLVVGTDGNLLLHNPDSSVRWSSGRQLNYLNSGEWLHGGEYVTAANGQFTLTMQADGNLVEYFGRRPLWSTWTYGHPGAVVTLQRDGNLVVYAPGGAPLWSSVTGGGLPGTAYQLAPGPDANLVVAAFGAGTRWANGVRLSNLLAGERLLPGQYLSSPVAPVVLAMQPDGQLIEYSRNIPIWIGGAGVAGSLATVQSDGNLVVNGPTGWPLWGTGSGGRPASAVSLTLWPDTAMVLTDGSGGTLWRTDGRTWGETEVADYAFPGQCTDGAQHQFHNVTGTWIRAGGLADTTGNADDWAANTRARGWTVTATPSLNSIVVFQPGVAGTNPWVGHVAWVVGVSGNTIWVNEENANNVPFTLGWNDPYPVVGGYSRGQPNMQFILVP